MTTFNPKLGGKPFDLLLDAKSLDRCLAILPEKRSGSRH